MMNIDIRFRSLVIGLFGVLYFSSSLAAENRTLNGTGNNLNLVNQGAAVTPMIRFGYGSQFSSAEGGMIGDNIRANARDISNAIFKQTHSVRSQRGLSDYIWAWGQFVGHDTDLVTSSNGAVVNGSAPIAINDPLDPLGPQPIPFTRANHGTTASGGGGRSGGGTSRSTINEVTSYIDASQSYGSSEARASALRTTGGKLLLGDNNLLPLNTMGLEMENRSPLPNSLMFAAGDIRANENPLLTSLQTVFAREHNRLVDVIAAQQPLTTEEERFQLARKLVGAEMQIITYREFLPALVGHGASTPRAEAYAYTSSLNASVTNAFAHAAYRFGHSAVSSTMNLVDELGQDAGDLSLRSAFFNPTLLTDDPQLMDDLLRGAARQKSQEIDTLIVDDLRSFLFGPPGAGGLDLAAINIQRGRDAGLPHYASLRNSHGLGWTTNFAQITTDADLAGRLSALYGGNVDNIDAWVGGLAENHVPGASVGPFMKAVIESQFRRLRDGDRLFYLSNAAGLYTNKTINPEIAAIVDLNALRLSDILRWNTDISSLQGNVFFAVPEPQSLGLLFVGLLFQGLVVGRRNTGSSRACSARQCLRTWR
jgi:peroxidase